MIIEAAVETLDAALAAAEGGADRIELCTNLAHGGTTPDVQQLQACKSQLTLPIFVLVRPRAGNYVYIHGEHRAMIRQIEQAKAAGAQGIVTGALTESNEIADGPTSELIAAARPLAVTFHRAFDACVDLSQALETLIRLGVDRVLTSGGAATAARGAPRIGQLVKQAMGRIVILPGGGINAGNIARLLRETAVREVHFSVRDAEKVRAVLRRPYD